MKNKPYFPMFIDLSDKNIVVVGGGNIATRRVKTLLSFTRNIRVIAPKVTMEMMELSKAGYVELLTRPVKRRHPGHKCTGRPGMPQKKYPGQQCVGPGPV